MKKFKHEMVKFSFWLLLFIILLISCIDTNLEFFIIASCLLTLTFIFLAFFEKSRITNNIKPFMEKKNYHEAINTIKRILSKVYFEQNLKYSLSILIELYMLNDEAVKAKSLLEHNLELQDVVNLYHIQLILALAEENGKKRDLILYKISLVKKKRYLKYKESIKPIIILAHRKEFNEELYQNTKYPLLKKLCLKYTDNPQTIDNLNLDIIIDDTLKSSRPIQLTLKIFLNILTFLSLVAALLLMLIIGKNNNSRLSLNILYENVYHYTKYYWVIFLFLIVSLTNVVIAIYFRSKKIKYYTNLLIGMIISITLVILGMTHLVVYNSFYTHKSYLHTHSYSIEIPEDYTLIKTSFKSTEVSQFSTTIIKSVTVIRIKDQDYKLINRREWEDGLYNMNWMPRAIRKETECFEYFKVHNVTITTQGTSSNPKKNEYIIYAYDIDTNILMIYNLELLK